MKKPNFIINIVFFPIIFSCTTDYKNKIETISNTDKINFESIGIKKFSTSDLRMGSFVNSIDYKDGELSFLNSMYNTLYIFDYQNEKLIETIKFEEEGPDGISFLGEVSSHTKINADSILIYNINLGYLFLVNRSSELLKKIPLTDYKSPENFPAPFPNTIRPIQHVNGKVYLASGINKRENNYLNFPSSIEVDINSNKVSFKTILLPIYNDAYWGSTFKYDLALGVLNNKLILNYPVDFNLHVYNLKDLKTPTSVTVGSKFFNEIPPFKKDLNYYKTKTPGVKDIEESNYSLSTSDFAGLLIDSFKDNVIRIAYIRPALFQVQEGNTIPDFSIIVSDSELNRLGELKLDGKIYDCTNIFITEEGLNVFRKDLYKEYEGYFSYEVFKYDLIQ